MLSSIFHYVSFNIILGIKVKLIKSLIPIARQLKAYFLNVSL